MAYNYLKRELTDGKTIIDKDLLDYMQDGIIGTLDDVAGIEADVEILKNQTIELDTDLIKSGHPADAKAVGDAIRDIEAGIVKTDIHLTESGTPADAAAVGDRLGSIEEAIANIESGLEIPVDPDLMMEGIPAEAAAVGAKIEEVKTEIITKIPELIPVDTSLEQAGVPADAYMVGKTIKQVKTEVIGTVKEEAIQEIAETGIKNPSMLKFTGYVEEEYDGSEEIVINIPTPGLGDVEFIAPEDIAGLLP